ncbi:MAG TPA: sugar ABC transporter permease [Ktedonobacteraceae bacterium]|nr:sugar ABC transporter permease [Ktedonobacteraceae bacterium]
MLQVKRSTIFLYLLPIIVSIAFISMTPILYTLYLSFTNNTEFNQEYNFVGLTNYIHLLFTSNSDLFYVLRQTILYVIACTLLFVLVGMITALALNNPKVKGTAVWMSLLLIPWAAPSAVTALIWKFLFNYDFGPINQIGRLFFGSHFGVTWLTDPTAAFIAVVIVNVWLSYPFFTVVILGALQSVPQELSEAARVDGANAWQAFWRITLPLVRPAIIPATILSAIGTFQMFNTVYLITSGGPIISADKPGATSFVMIYMYNQVLGASAANIHYGAIASFAITMFIVLAAVTFLARALGTQRTREARA